MIPKTMSVQEVCDVLKVHRKTLMRWEKEGKIPYTQVGHKHLYLENDIEKIIYERYRK